MGYMPTKESVFLTWSENFIAVVNLHRAEWNIAQEKVTELQTLHQAFAVLYEKCTTAEARRLDFQGKSEAKAALQRKERRLAMQLQEMDGMTDDWRTELGITLRERRPVPKPAPDTEPELKVRLLPPGVVEFLFRAGNAARWGKKAPNAKSLEVCWAFLTQPPASHSELSRSAFATSGAVRLEFDLPDRGKTLYYMARWLGAGSKHGPWTEIASVIVP